MKRSIIRKINIPVIFLSVIVAVLMCFALANQYACALNDSEKDSFYSPVQLFSDFIERVEEYDRAEKIDELIIKENKVEILENAIISEKAVIDIPEDSALVISGDVKNYGHINVYGKLIVKSGAVLDGDTVPGKGSQRYGDIKIERSGVMLIEENAEHIISNSGLIENNGTYLLDGILVTNGEIKNGNLIKLGEKAKLYINAVVSENGDFKSAETLNRYHQLNGGEISGDGKVIFYRNEACTNLPLIEKMSFYKFYERIETEWA